MKIRRIDSANEAERARIALSEMIDESSDVELAVRLLDAIVEYEHRVEGVARYTSMLRTLGLETSHGPSES